MDSEPSTRKPSTPGATAMETPPVRRKWSWLRLLCSCVLIAVLMIFFIVTTIILILNNDLRDKNYSMHGGILGSRTAPGIGFDFTPSYGTVAIRFHNGSTFNVAKIDADQDYQEMMREISRPQIFMMARLRAATEDYLGESFPAAVIATPMFPTLCKNDITDAAQLNHITAVSRGKMFTQPRELSAAFAGLGFGICANYTDSKVCDAEEGALPIVETLLVSLSNATLFVRRYAMHPALTSYEPPWTMFVNYTLGTDVLRSIGNDGPRKKEEYWSKVEDHIRQLYLRKPEAGVGRPCEKVLLIGESAAVEEYQLELINAVQRVLLIRQGNIIPKYYTDEPLYLAARGAAEFAKRAQETAGADDHEGDDGSDSSGEGSEL